MQACSHVEDELVVYGHRSIDEDNADGGAVAARVDAQILDAAAAAGVELPAGEASGIKGLAALGAAFLRSSKKPSKVQPKRGRCSDCGNVFDLEIGLQATSGSAGTTSKRALLCELCRFRSMDPFRPLLEAHGLLHFSRLEPGCFVIPLQLPELRQWRKTGSDVELRMLRRSSNGSSSDRHPLHQSWPRKLEIRVNEKKALVVKRHIRLHRRRDVPLVLSSFLRAGPNKIELRSEDECSRDFVVSAVRTQARKPRQLKRLARSPTLDECVERMRGLLVDRSGGDGGRCTDKVERVGDERLLLRCPITLTRPTSLPARGAECRHLQCFDLEAYLVATFRTRAFNNRWQCPLCGLDTRPEELCVDSFVNSILDATDDATDEVWFSADCTWRVQASSEAGGCEGGSEDQRAQARAVAPVCVIEDDPADMVRKHKEGRKCGTNDRWKPRKPSKTSKSKGHSKPGRGKRDHATGRDRNGKHRTCVAERKRSSNATETTSVRNKDRQTASSRRPKAKLTPRKLPKVSAMTHAIDLDSDAAPEDLLSDSCSEDRLVAPSYF